MKVVACNIWSNPLASCLHVPKKLHYRHLRMMRDGRGGGKFNYQLKEAGELTIFRPGKGGHCRNFYLSTYPPPFSIKNVCSLSKDSPFYTFTPRWFCAEVLQTQFHK